MKNHVSCSNTPGHTTERQAVEGRPNHAGGAWMSQYATPQRMNSAAISDSVHAVTTPITAKIAHCPRSRARVRAASFHAARLMIPITAAPTP